VLQSTQLIKDTPQRPNVRCVSVRLGLADLWGHIVGRPLHSESSITRILEYLTDTEIAKFNSVVSCQKHVLELQVAVEDLASVHIFKRHTDLDEPVHDFSL